MGKADNQIIDTESIDDMISNLGVEAQAEVGEVSTELSNLLKYNTEELESAISTVTAEVDDTTLLKKKSILQSRDSYNKKIISKYNKVFLSIDKLTLLLRLQEAQLIKDSEILKRLRECIVKSRNNLDGELIRADNLKRMVIEIQNNKQRGIAQKERIERKEFDIKTSIILAEQMETQIELMLENNQKLIDRILANINTTIPLWKNKVNLVLGIEKKHKEEEIANKVLDAVGKYTTNTLASIDKHKIEDIDIDKILATNIHIKNILQELEELEHKSDSIKNETIKGITL